MQTLPYISVILPVRNGGLTLQASMLSILNQTMQNFELLVMNDGSTDTTVSIANGFADARVRVLGDDVQRGLTYRLNEGIDAARGQYIARMDADDLAFPERFEKQLAFLQIHPEVDLVGCRPVVFHNSHVVGLFPFAGTHEEICEKPWRGFYLAHPSWMGKATWFRQYRYRVPEVMRAEDQELLLRSHQNSRFACLPDVLLAYRIHDFDFLKTFMARRSLCAVQLAYFSKRKQWAYLSLIVIFSVLRVISDIITALPGASWIFNLRMSNKIPSEVSMHLKALGIHS